MSTRDLVIRDYGSVEGAVAELVGSLDWPDQVLALRAVLLKLFTVDEILKFVLVMLGSVVADECVTLSEDNLDRLENVMDALCEVIERARAEVDAEAS